MLIVKSGKVDIKEEEKLNRKFIVGVFTLDFEWNQNKHFEITSTKMNQKQNYKNQSSIYYS